MAFHITWGDPTSNYMCVHNAADLDSALDAITEKLDEPVIVVIDHERTSPATQLRILAGHPDRAAAQWTSYSSPPCRLVAVDESLPQWPVSIACDSEGAPMRIPPAQTQLTFATARQAALDYVSGGGALPGRVPVWAPRSRR